MSYIFILLLPELAIFKRFYDFNQALGYNHKNKRFWTFISDIRIRGWTIRWAKKFPFFSHSWPCATRLIYYHRQWWKPFNLSLASPTKIKGLTKPGGPAGGGHLPYRILAAQLALSQPEGHIMPTTLLRAPRMFRPCDGPVRLKQTNKPHYLNTITTGPSLEFWNCGCWQ